MCAQNFEVIIDDDGYEVWLDENKKAVYIKTTSDFKVWKQYNLKGQKVYEKNSDGLEEWWNHHENGEVFYYKNSDGKEYWFDENGYEIDKNGNLIIDED